MISVIIPLYNKSSTVCRTVATILQQTYKDFELIIVDDGSTDGGLDLLKSHFNDNRIRYISKANSGVSATRNLGVKESRGDWVTFLDADDLWLPTYLEEMAGMITRNPDADMVGCASYGVYFCSNVVHTNRMIDKYYGKEGRINYFMCMDSMSHIGATCIRKDVFNRIGGFDVNVRNNEDILLMAKIALEGNYIYLGKMLHVYMLDVPGQVTRDPRRRVGNMRDVLYVLNELFSYSRNFNNKLVRSALRFRFYDYLFRFLSMGDYAMLGYFIAKVDNGLVHSHCIGWMKSPRLKFMACLYVYGVKMMWRLRGFQSRSHKSRFEAELLKQYSDNHDFLSGVDESKGTENVKSL